MGNPLSLFSYIWPDKYDENGNPLCRVCNRPVTPPKRYYCSDECSRLAVEALNWEHARYLVWERAGGKCEFPGCDKILPLHYGGGEVHHKIPVRKLYWFVCDELEKDPDFEKLSKEEQKRARFMVYAFLHNHPSNLILLCKEHHNMVHSAERRRAFGVKDKWDCYVVGGEWRDFWFSSSQTSLLAFIEK